MKKYIAMAALFMGVTVNAQKLTIANIDNAKAGEQVLIELGVESEIPIVGFQVKLGLPETMTVGATKTWEVDETRDPEETYEYKFGKKTKVITCASPDGLSGEKFVGTSGTVIRIPLTIDASVADGIYEITMTEMEVNVTADEKEMTTIIPEDTSFKIGVGTGTGIDGIEASDNAKNAPIYNLAGQRVSKAQKGIFIQNGKKIAVK